MELVKSILGTAFRTLLASVGAWLINKGYIKENDFETLLVGGVSVLSALIWGIWQKYKSRLEFLAALELPAGAPEEQAKEKAKTPEISSKAFLSLLVLLSLIGFSGSQVACAKRPEAKSAVYSAQTVAALQGTHQVLFVLQDAGVVQAGPAKSFYSTHDQIAKSLEVLFARIQAGGYAKKDAILAVEQIIGDVEKFEAQLDLVKDPNAQGKLDQVLFTLKFGLNSLKAIIEASKEPNPEELNGAIAKLKSPVRANWWPDVILVVQNTFLRTFAQSRMDAPTAWADAAVILDEIHKANAARLAQ